MYGLFYTACSFYNNQLTSSLFYFICQYLPIAILAAIFFLTAGKNPGFLIDHPVTTTQARDDVEMQQI